MAWLIVFVLELFCAANLIGGSLFGPIQTVIWLALVVFAVEVCSSREFVGFLTVALHLCRFGVRHLLIYLSVQLLVVRRWLWLGGSRIGPRHGLMRVCTCLAIHVGWSVPIQLSLRLFVIGRAWHSSWWCVISSVFSSYHKWWSGTSVVFSRGKRCVVGRTLASLHMWVVVFGIVYQQFQRQGLKLNLMI